MTLLTFTQRSIHVVLQIKSNDLGHEKPFPTGTVGDLLRERRQVAGLTRQQLSQATGIPLCWLGRRERDRSFPSEAEWSRFSVVLALPATNPVIDVAFL